MSASAISIDEFNMSIPSENGERLRTALERLGRVLIWHAQNTPGSVWAEAARSYTARDIWPANLLHWLNLNRPKREPTKAELAAIMELLRGHTLLEETFARIISDPDWTIFQLSLIDDCNRTDAMKIINNPPLHPNDSI